MRPRERPRLGVRRLVPAHVSAVTCQTGTRFTSMSRDTAEGTRSCADAVLAGAGIEPDCARGKSACIAITGLREIPLQRHDRLAIIIGG